MKTPDTVFQYDMKNKTKEILKQKTVMGGYDASQYVTERFLFLLMTVSRSRFPWFIRET